jgi:hypothetical protein
MTMNNLNITLHGLQKNIVFGKKQHAISLALKAHGVSFNKMKMSHKIIGGHIAFISHEKQNTITLYVSPRINKMLQENANVEPKAWIKDILIGNRTTYSAALVSSRLNGDNLSILKNMKEFTFTFEPKTQLFIFCSPRVGHLEIANLYQNLKNIGVIDEIPDMLLSGAMEILNNNITQVLVQAYRPSTDPAMCNPIYKIFVASPVSNEQICHYYHQFIIGLKTLGCEDSAIIKDYMTATLRFVNNNIHTLAELKAFTKLHSYSLCDTP